MPRLSQSPIRSPSRNTKKKQTTPMLPKTKTPKAASPNVASQSQGRGSGSSMGTSSLGSVAKRPKIKAKPKPRKKQSAAHDTMMSPRQVKSQPNPTTTKTEGAPKGTATASSARKLLLQEDKAGAAPKTKAQLKSPARQNTGAKAKAKAKSKAKKLPKPATERKPVAKFKAKAKAKAKAKVKAKPAATKTAKTKPVGKSVAKAKVTPKSKTKAKAKAKTKVKAKAKAKTKAKSAPKSKAKAKAKTKAKAKPKAPAKRTPRKPKQSERAEEPASGTTKEVAEPKRPEDMDEDELDWQAYNGGKKTKIPPPLRYIAKDYYLSRGRLAGSFTVNGGVKTRLRVGNQIVQVSVQPFTATAKEAVLAKENVRLDLERVLVVLASLNFSGGPMKGLRVTVVPYSRAEWTAAKDYDFISLETRAPLAKEPFEVRCGYYLNTDDEDAFGANALVAPWDDAKFLPYTGRGPVEFGAQQVRSHPLYEDNDEENDEDKENADDDVEHAKVAENVLDLKMDTAFSAFVAMRFPEQRDTVAGPEAVYKQLSGQGAEAVEAKVTKQQFVEEGKSPVHIASPPAKRMTRSKTGSLPSQRFEPEDRRQSMIGQLFSMVRTGLGI
eukprot:Clim_evm2s159 gene=Clim_evmTU2s159